MNSCSMTVLIPSSVQQTIHIVARMSLRLHEYKGLQLMERSLCSVLSRSQQIAWDNLICARNIFHLHFALRKSESTVNNILSIPIYSAQFHGVLPLTQLEQDQSLIIKKTHFYSCSPALCNILCRNGRDFFKK